MQIRKILVPVDGSCHSLKALGVAKKMAGVFDSKIVLIHVVNPTHAREVSNYVLDEAALEEIRVRRTKIVDDAQCECGGGDYEKYTVLGDPAEEILKKLKEDEIDLLIIAKKGVSEMERYIMGSVSAKIIEHSPKSVYLIQE